MKEAKNKWLLRVATIAIIVLLCFITYRLTAIKYHPAAQVATQAAMARGWKMVEVQSVRKEGQHWVVLLHRVPRVTSGVARVEVSESGEMLVFSQ